jgi:hypothetical protein
MSSPTRRARMKLTVVTIVVIALGVASLPGQERYQRANLRQLSEGTPVVITTVSGANVEGGFKSLTAERVILITNGGDTRQFPIAGVHTVTATRRDSVWNGVFGGAGLGFGGGAGLGAAWFHGSGRYGAKPPGYRRDFITGVDW